MTSGKIRGAGSIWSEILAPMSGEGKDTWPKIFSGRWFITPRLIDRLDSATLVKRSPDLKWIKIGQAPDLPKRNPASGLPLAKRAERRLSLPFENFVDAGKDIDEPALWFRNNCSHTNGAS
jgi:hypothetical protein